MLRKYVSACKKERERVHVMGVSMGFLEICRYLVLLVLEDILPQLAHPQIVSQLKWLNKSTTLFTLCESLYIQVKIVYKMFLLKSLYKSLCEGVNRLYCVTKTGNQVLLW